MMISWPQLTAQAVTLNLNRATYNSHDAIRVSGETKLEIADL